MKREKLAVVQREFPFLEEIVNKTMFDLSMGQIRITDLGTLYLDRVPKLHFWYGEDGCHTILERTFVVKDGEVSEITTQCVEVIHNGLTKYFREGQSIGSSLMDLEPDFVVWFLSERASFVSHKDSEIITIFRANTSK
jgi:hypothetical protein